MSKDLIVVIEQLPLTLRPHPKQQPQGREWCPVCDSTGQKFLYTVRDWRFGHEGEFSLVECVGCSLVYLNPRPTAEELAAFYPRHYPAHVSVSRRKERGALLRWLRAAALHHALGYPAESGPVARFAGWCLGSLVLRRPYPRFRPGGRLLDVGCGRGDYLLSMRAKGWDVTGIDMSPVAVKQAGRRGLPVYRGRLIDLELPAESFDVVTFCDSFEHHPDPRETLLEAARVLRSGGELLIVFPNFSSPWRRVFGRYWADIAAPRHLYHYTRQTLSRLVESCGFEVEYFHSQPSAEISRSLRIWRSARQQQPAKLPQWARLLDFAFARGHLMLRARRRPTR